ncbi:alpha-L-fucosidase [Pseudactinotalea sp. Z1739]|uniref:alpha-L-fucosidase n=1 Tax=Pseudactinotalea sp. Z1739 TaxID=3413028 RepID=UPI003C7D7711
MPPLPNSPTMRLIPPSPGQRAWQDLELGFFCHFGVNTFHGMEWSDGTLPAASFNPRDLDAAQWVRTAQDAGAGYFILTAKHHDGFCLWPTATTDYSVASSPWRDGRGDVVAEVARACREAGMPFGLYLSPWDRNAACYDDPDAYDRFYQAQLRELCTGYGPLVELWFDGAGSHGRAYDWDGVMAVIDQFQPQAMVFNMGRPTIRWIGNEDGLAADPVHYVVESTEVSNYVSDTAALDAPRYLPPECDVSLRRGWFWARDDEPKSTEHLLGIYYRSVGMGTNLLLNVPPDDRGLIGDDDAARLRQWRTELDRRFARPIRAHLSGSGDVWTATFEEPVTIDHVELAEDYNDGQRIGAHRVLIDDDAAPARTDSAGAGVLAAGLSVGHKRLHAVSPVTVRRLRIELRGASPRLRSVRAYRAGTSGSGRVEYRASTDEPEANPAVAARPPAEEQLVNGLGRARDHH